MFFLPVSLKTPVVNITVCLIGGVGAVWVWGRACEFACPMGEVPGWE